MGYLVAFVDVVDCYSFADEVDLTDKKKPELRIAVSFLILVCR